MSENPEHTEAIRDLEAASKKMRSGSPSAEKDYGVAYQKCVALGLRPAIRKRYR